MPSDVGANALCQTQRIVVYWSSYHAGLRSLNGGSTRDGEELFDLFITDGTAIEKVAWTDFGDLVRRITVIRQREPDDIGLSDIEIAMRIHDFAQGQAGR